MVTSIAEALVRRVIPSGQRDRETDFVTALIEHAWRTGVDFATVQADGLLRAYEVKLQGFEGDEGYWAKIERTQGLSALTLRHRPRVSTPSFLV